MEKWTKEQINDKNWHQQKIYRAHPEETFTKIKFENNFILFFV